MDIEDVYETLNIYFDKNYEHPYKPDVCISMSTNDFAQHVLIIFRRQAKPNLNRNVFGKLVIQFRVFIKPNGFIVGYMFDLFYCDNEDMIINYIVEKAMNKNFFSKEQVVVNDILE